MVVDCLIMSPQFAFVWWQNEDESPLKKKKIFFFFRETPTSPWVPFRVKFRPLGWLFRPIRPLAWSLGNILVWLPWWVPHVAGQVEILTVSNVTYWIYNHSWACRKSRNFKNFQPLKTLLWRSHSTTYCADKFLRHERKQIQKCWLSQFSWY